MANAEKMSIALTPEMADMVREAVKTGDYASTSEVVREALRDWKQRRSLRADAIEDIRRLWEEGVASGPGRLADIDAVNAEARRRSTRKRRTA
jgi:antitoxin ParD1/3/4